MASTSSSVGNSQYCPPWRYDVFLSFRGEDTRNTFTSHLEEGLRKRGIVTFQDEKRLEHGDLIPEKLLKAIKESQVALIVFSKNYATSRWCLDELVKIMACKDKNGQIVIPVFYNVDPSHVRNQRESFAEAFAKHESNYKDDVEGMQKVQGWRTALTKAANLKGCDTRSRIESECIRDLVDQISSKLCKTSLSYLEDIVGINTHLEKVKSLLKMEINDARIVGIWGIGGVGKTTIARAIFDTLSSQFDGACFLADIKENKNGMHSLQNIVLSELLREEKNYVNNKMDGKHLIARRLRVMKVLVVLDDINHEDHLEYLAGDLHWFGNGSRIIATTRDKHFIGKNDVVYEVTTLVKHEAIQLFNQYAFKKEVPDECFEELTLEVVNHAKGLPLALKVWGSFLHKRDITEWRSAINRIKKNSSSKIVESLKVSYDGLEREEQEIFLDIACFLRGRKKFEIMQIFESCGFEANIGLSVLIEKSLVFISTYDTIQIHDLIQDMGKYVVNMQKDPGERSRLWLAEDIEEVMVNNTAVEAIWFDYQEKLCFSKEAMKNMKMLRILYMGFFDWSGDSCHDGCMEYLPNNLRWFVWYRYPWESLPATFEPKRLVHLELGRSELRQLWKETKHLPSPRRLDLSYSKILMGTLDFKGMPNLKYLNLRWCSNLEEVHHSLGYCGKLSVLNLWHCKSLKRFPCVNVESLEYLDLRGCSSLEKFPEILGRMKPELKIKMRNSGIRVLASSIQYLTHITELDLGGMKNLVALPSNIGMLKSLMELNVSHCLKLEILPEEIGDLESLVELDVSNCSKLESLPEQIGDLEILETLDASYTLISQPPSSIVRLNKLKFLTFAKQKSQVGLNNGVYFVFPQINEGLHSLERLDLSYCNLIDGGLPGDIGCLSSLKELNLSGNSFQPLPRSISQLGALQSLDLSDCERLKQLPDIIGMPNLETLNLSNCMNLEEVHHSLGFLKKLLRLELTNCKRLKRFPALCIDSLEYLGLEGCSSLENFPEILRSVNLELKSGISHLDLSGLENLVTLSSSIGMWKSLVGLDVSGCSKLESLPEDMGDLENLERLDANCTLISQLPSSIVRLNKLEFLSFEKQKSEVGLEDGVYFVFPPVSDGLRLLEILNLNYCNLIDGGIPVDIGCLSSLKRLYLKGNNFEYLPRSIAQLGALRSLDLRECKRLVELPGFMGMPNLVTLNLSNCMNLEQLPDFVGMPNLETLNLSNCMNLEVVHHSLGFLKKLLRLELTNCKRLKRFPEEIGDLEELERLDASYTLISRPSPSIFRLNKLKFLSFAKQKSKVGLEYGVYFVFPQVNEGLCSLENLDLDYCNLIDGGLPEDIGSLSSLKKLYLTGNNFEHLPRSIAQLGALRSLCLLDCARLAQLPEFPQQLDTIYADWSNDWICNSLFQNISSLQHDISALDSLSLRVFTSRIYDFRMRSIPSWFRYQGMDTNVLVNLPKNWYVPDNFLGFAVCYSGSLVETTAQLIPLCDDGMSWMTQKLALSNHSECDTEPTIQFFLVPLAGLWDTSKANGKTPNDYGRIRLSFYGEMEFGLRLLYKDEAELDALLQMRENNDEPTEHCIGTSSEHHESVSNEAVAPLVETKVTLLEFVGSLFLRICSNK